MESAGEPSKTPPAYPIASVNNALKLLQMFRDREQVRLSDASNYLGVAHSTAHRLLAMLAYHDFVRQESSQRAYVAGPALVEVGLAAVRNMDIRSHARAVLEDLADRCGETVHLARLEGDQVFLLDAVESRQALRVAARIGHMVPAHCTAAGKAMLAGLSDDHLRQVYPLRRPLATVTTHSISRRSDLDEELARVRKQGYATAEEESDDGVASMAAAVRSARGGPVAALSVSVPLSRLPDGRREDLVERVLDATRRLTETLAGS